MSEIPQLDLTFTIGETFIIPRMVQYSDARIARWRGTYNENWLYKPGDGVVNAIGDILGDLEQGGEAFVAIRETKRGTPGENANSAFWSPARVWNLTGYMVQFIVEGVFTVTIPTPEITAKLGVLEVSVAPTHFVSPPESSRYWLKATSPSEVVSYLLHGDAFFVKP